MSHIWARPRLVLGTFGMATDPARRMTEVDAIHCALDHGIEVFDTAPLYAEGQAEGLLGHALRGSRRERAFVVTKIHPWEATKSLTRSECESSLARMGLDHIDLYLLHWRGPVPLEESVEALERLRGAGLIRDWGVSNFDLDDVLLTLKLRSRHDSLVNQVLFNPLRRAAERRLIEAVPGRLALMGYSPFERDRGLDMTLFRSLANAYSADPHAVVLAWCMSRGVSPVFKAAQADHVKANAQAIELRLSASELRAIDLAFPSAMHPTRLEREDTVSPIAGC